MSVKLQGPYVDVAHAHHEITTVKTALQDVRADVTSFHARIFAQACRMVQSVDVEESRPRLASRQQHRHNISAQSAEDYFRLNLTIPLLDHLIGELNTRFDEASSQNLTEFMCLLPSGIYATKRDQRDFENITKFQEPDLPSLISFESEVDLWQRKWRAERQLASTLDTPEKASEHADTDLIFVCF